MKILCPLLGALFIGLKLTGVIAWSWWLVTAPIWAPPLIGLAIAGGCVLTALALANRD